MSKDSLCPYLYRFLEVDKKIKETFQGEPISEKKNTINWLKILQGIVIAVENLNYQVNRAALKCHSSKYIRGPAGIEILYD